MAAQDLPQLPSGAIDARAQQPFERVQQELRRLMGFTGDPADMAVTYGALVAAGLLSKGALARVRPGSGTAPGGIVGGGTAGPPGVSGPPGPPGAGAEPPDLTPPPNVLGLTAVGLLANVLVEWTAAAYTVGHGPGATRIYAALRNPGDPNAVFANAKLVYEAPHPLTIAAIPSEANMRWHIWATFVTVDGVESPSPAGGTNGWIVTTGQDVSHLLAVLTGAIRTSELQAALVTRIDLIDAGSGVAGSVNARILTETTARTSADTALSSSITTLTSSVGANAAAISAEAVTRASGDAANASAITTVQSVVQSAPGNLLANSSFEQDPSGDGLAAGWGVYNNSPGTEPSTPSRTPGRTGGFAQRLTWAVANTSTKGFYSGHEFVEGGIPGGVPGGWRAGATYVVSWYAKAGANWGFGTLLEWNVAPASSVAQLNPNLTTSWQRYATLITMGGSVEANGRFFITASTGSPMTGYLELDDVQIEEGSILTAYKVSVSDTTALVAAVQQEASTRASVDGHISALYAVRVQLTGAGRTVVGGFGIMGTNGGTAGPMIDFGVLANRFYVGAPVGTAGVTDVQPFVVQTTDETINGVLIPKGVYMDAAYIKNLTAMVARLGNAWIDDAKIASLSAAKITAGSISVGAYIQSTNYVGGTSGWRIHGDGTAEFSGVIVRGTVIATAGSIGGNTIDSTGVQSPGFLTGSAGWRLRSDGSAEFRNVVVRGDVQASSINIGSGGGARTEYRDDVIRVYDSGGNLRVKIGNLA